MPARIPIKSALVGANFILEKWVNGQRVASIFLPLVTSYSRTRIPTMKRRWTMPSREGEVRPYKEFSGHRAQRQQDIALAGSSGLAIRSGSNRYGQEIAASGYELFKEFESFLDIYLEEQQKHAGVEDRNPQKAPQLVFKALHERDAFYVELDPFRVDRNSDRNNLTWAWSLALKTEGVFLEPKDPQASPSGRQKARDESADRTREGVTNSAFGSAEPQDRVLGAGARDRFEGTQTQEDVTEFTTTSGRSIEGELNRLNPLMRDIREPVLRLLNAVRSAQSTLGALRAVTQFPVTVVNDLGDLARATNGIIADTVDALPIQDREEVRRQFTQISSQIDRIELDCAAHLGQWGFRRVESPRLSEPGPVQHPVIITAPQHAVMYRMPPNSDLVDVARTELGDGGRWQEIVKLNGMLSDWQLADGRRLKEGEIIFVPSQDGVEVIHGRSIFGTDAKWWSDGTFRWRDGDWVLVRGIACFRQGIIRRCVIAKRSNKGFPDLGLEPMAHRKALSHTTAAAISDVYAQMQSDHRVASVEKVEAVLVRDRLGVSFEVVPVAGKSLPVTVPFPAAAA